jgi:hypothetical protein
MNSPSCNIYYTVIILVKNNISRRPPSLRLESGLAMNEDCVVILKIEIEVVDETLWLCRRGSGCLPLGFGQHLLMDPEGAWEMPILTER